MISLSPPPANGKPINRLVDVAADAKIGMQRAVVAAYAFQRAAGKKYGIGSELITDSPTHALLTAVEVYYHAHPEATQAPPLALSRFIASMPELRDMFQAERLTPEGVKHDLEKASYDLDFVGSYVEVLRDDSLDQEWKKKTAALEPLPIQRRIHESLAFAKEMHLQASARSGLRSEILTIGQMADQFPQLREPLIEGICRQGEIVNLISKSKIGKSWMGYGLALSIAVGLPWLGKFPCRRGRVLVIDNELHPELIAYRIPEVAMALEIKQTEYRDQVDVLSLRGRLRDINQIGEVLNESIRDVYAAVIVDAWYRMQPVGFDENTNGSNTDSYNQVCRYADQTGAAFFLIHHATKGDQSSKDITDVGAGGGAQSRAADTHLILRPHEAENAVVLDGVCRSFAPVEPIVLEWIFPLWSRAADLDPKALKTTKPGSGQSKEDRLNDKRRKVVEYLMQPEVRDSGATKSSIKDHTGVNAGLVPVLESLVKDRNLVLCQVKNPRNNQAYDGWKLMPEKGN